MKKEGQSNGGENHLNFTGERRRHLLASLPEERKHGSLTFSYQMLCFNYHSRNIVFNLCLFKFSGLELSAFTGYPLATLIS